MPRKVLSITEALKHPLRRRILLTILENPGISLHSISKKLGSGVGNIAGHLTILERVGLVRSVKTLNRNYFYVNTSLLVNGVEEGL